MSWPRREGRDRVRVVTVVWSLVAGGAFVGAGLVVAVTVRRLCFPTWRGSAAATTMVVVWLCWALGLGQLLGAVGLLRRMALLAAALVCAGAAAVGARAVESSEGPEPARPVWGKGSPEAEAPPASGAPGVRAAPGTAPAPTKAPALAATSRGNLLLTAATVVLVLFVAAVWSARTAIAVHRGINDPDSLAYHVPFAVTFAQSGYADQNRLLVPLLPVQFFPANDELLSGMALAITHSVAFAAAKNLIFGGFVVLAAHALGRAFEASRLTVAASAVVLGFPVVAFSQPGEAVNDTLLLLVLVGGLAVLAHARDRPAPYVLALACAGLGIGVKFSGLVPGAVLGALAVTLLLARVARHRWRWAGIGLLGAAGMGGSWYARNAVRYGNPIPPVRVALGPFHLHAIHGLATDLSFSVAHYVAHGQLLGTFARGLVRGLGPLIVVIGAVCVWGVVAGLRSPDGLRRGLGALGAVTLPAYLVTPASAYGPISQVAENFVVNLHYAAPPMLFGTLAAAIALAARRWAWAVPLVGIVAVATSIGPGRGIAFWSPEIGGPGFVVLLLAAAGAGAVSSAWARPSLRRFAVAGTAVVAVIAVGAGAAIAARYPSRRAADPVVRWAATVGGARIGVWVGDVPDLINLGNLYGPGARNRVVNLNRLVDGAAVPLDSCPALMLAARDGHFGYLAATKGSPGFGWLRADPAFRVVADETVGASVHDLVYLRRYRAVVFQVVGAPDVGCRSR